MSLRKIFCPNCGQETQVNDDRAFCFCLECGNKILLKTEENKQNAIEHEVEAIEKNNEIEKKLEEAAFFYKMSQDKKEYENYDIEPIYYLRAQDILVDLSEQYPNDYRIWWELCKPIDFSFPSSGADIYDQYHINEDYFKKALDRAELSQKSILIDEHDSYIKSKSIIKAEIEKQRLEEEARKQEEEEKERLAAKVREQEEKEKNIEQSQILWAALQNKEYSRIDNCYFTFLMENNQKIIGIFKAVSNMMYLMAFREDGNKANTVYREQSISIKFDQMGHGMTFNNTPVKIRGALPPNNILQITCDGVEGLLINGMTLSADVHYVENIIKRAKKPMLSFTKIFD